MNQRLIHDVAMAMAVAILELVEGCIRPEEQRDAFEEFYCACKAGLENYEMQRAGMTQRLYPTKN
jgi:hypothetical protein